MAIYDAGTASLSADGTVTGVGTTWRQPLTLIRVGATMIFNTSPISIVTIAEILSDTSIRAFNDKGFIAPAGTQYFILAHDGITVQGLAQDVAETLRYYQSRETEISAAVDAFNDFDVDEFQQNVTNVNNQSQQVSADAATVSSYAAQVSADKDSAASSATDASNSASQAMDAASSVSGALIGTFQAGVTIESESQQIIDISNGTATVYLWAGQLPKVVPPGSSPESTGGVSSSAWLKVSGSSRYPYIVVGNSSSEAKINSRYEAIVDESTNMHWVYEGTTPLTVAPGTVPPSQPMQSYKISGWRCVGLLSGFDERDARNYGAACDGAADDYNAYQLALYHTKDYVTHSGDCRIASGTLIKPPTISIIGTGGYVGAQLGDNIPTSTLTFDGPTGSSVYAIDNGQPASTEDSGRIDNLYIRAIGNSRESIGGVQLTKSAQIVSCGILNFSTGIKTNGGSAYVQIHKNNINSCNCCIDIGGSESHITNNHGYNDSLRTSSPFRPAMLIRSSGNIITGNKFFGDGSNTPKGVEIWGFGNVVSNNVFDAFTDIGVLVICNDTSIAPDNNSIIGNQISAIGDSSDTSNTYRAGIVVSSGGNGTAAIRATLITGNTMFNKRTDRQMKYGVVVDGTLGSNGTRTIYETTISGNSFGNGIEDRKVISLGSNHNGTKVTNNGGWITHSFGSGAYTHGQYINHGMDRPPEFIQFSLTDSGEPVAISFTEVTASSFRIYIRNSTSGISGTRAISWKAERVSP